jgi:hypothetical protein
MRIQSLGALLAAGLACGAGAGSPVVFAEDFEDALPALAARFGHAATEGVRIAQEPRPGSPGTHSLVLGKGANSYLYRQIPDQDQLYVRVFVRYDGNTDLDHSGVYVGGYFPPSPHALGDAGLAGVRPGGDRLVNIGLEAPALSAPERHDLFMNWIDMPGPPFGADYWGRSLLQSEGIPIVPGRWRCLELMVKQNRAADAKDGELALWIDGALVQHFRPGHPTGRFDEAGNWRSAPDGTPFPGLRWRDTLDFGFNWVKLQQFHEDGGGAHDVLFDDLVVSRERVGCD